MGDAKTARLNERKLRGPTVPAAMEVRCLALTVCTAFAADGIPDTPHLAHLTLGGIEYPRYHQITKGCVCC